MIFPIQCIKTIRAAADLGVWMVNVHTSGGRTMLTQARQAINDSQNKPLLIAVTILTSLSASGSRRNWLWAGCRKPS